MAKAFIDDTNLTNIADAIRATLDESRQYLPSEMAAAIQSIPVMVQFNRKKYFCQVPSQAASGYATIEQIEGNTVVWNQLVQNGDFSDGTNGWSSIFSTSPIVSVTDGILKITKNANGGTGNWYANTTQPTYYSTHKYYIALDAWNEDGETSIGFAFYNANYGLGSNIAINVTSNTRRRYSVIGSPQTTGNKWTLRVGSSVTPMGKVGYFDNLVIHDLTAIFGAGNEPSTVADFEAWLAQNIGTLPYYDYNAGELLSVKMQSVKSVGFNQFDELMEHGAYSYSTGNKQGGSTTARSVNKIKVFPSTTYYFKAARGAYRVCFYDYLGNFISSLSGFSGVNSTFVTPEGCGFITFGMNNVYGTIYNHDISINISDPNKNGTYKQYMTDSADIDVTTITGMNTSTNVREVIFPNGMKQADREGTVKDTLDLRSDTATVRCGYYEISGSESWEAVSSYPGVYRISSRTPSNVANMSGDSIGKCSHYALCQIRAGVSSILTNGQFGWNQSYYLHIKDERFLDATSFKAYLAAQYAAGTPVTIVYPINPITYTDLQDANGNPLNPRYKVEQGGTEQVLPVNTSTPTTVAPTLTTVYTKDNN